MALKRDDWGLGDDVAIGVRPGKRPQFRDTVNGETSHALADPAFPNGMLVVNDLARILAGMPTQDESPCFHSLIQSRAWQEHSERIDDLFRQFKSCYAAPFSSWAEASLGAARSARTVFYPFSGPDFAFPYMLYPDAENYILCGLESCDPLPEISPADESRLLNSLQRTTTAVSHYLKYSYFITRDLREDLHDEFLPGILPVLLVLLARTDCTITSASPIRLQPEPGQLTSASSEGVEGLCIEFHRLGAKSRLFYFRQDLRNDSFSRDSALFQFIASFAKPAVFLKSASYLLHEPNLSTVRNLILENGSIVVQDPSSLPYRLFLQQGWDVDLHGNYVGTIPVFGKYEQPDLIQAYRTATPKHLSFGFSYLTNPEAASLMVATPRRSIDQDVHP